MKYLSILLLILIFSDADAQIDTVTTIANDSIHTFIINFTGTQECGNISGYVTGDSSNSPYFVDYKGIGVKDTGYFAPKSPGIFKASYHGRYYYDVPTRLCQPFNYERTFVGIALSDSSPV